MDSTRQVDAEGCVGWMNQASIKGSNNLGADNVPLRLAA